MLEIFQASSQIHLHRYVNACACELLIDSFVSTLLMHVPVWIIEIIYLNLRYMNHIIQSLSYPLHVPVTQINIEILDASSFVC